MTASSGVIINLLAGVFLSVVEGGDETICLASGEDRSGRKKNCRGRQKGSCQSNSSTIVTGVSTRRFLHNWLRCLFIWSFVKQAVLAVFCFFRSLPCGIPCLCCSPEQQPEHDQLVHYPLLEVFAYLLRGGFNIGEIRDLTGKVVAILKGNQFHISPLRSHPL